MASNSNKDPAALAARDKTLALMKEVAEVAKVAVDAFAQDPRWCGLPGRDAGSSAEGLFYPYSHRLTRFLDAAAKGRPKKRGWDPTDGLNMPTDSKSGAEFHVHQIWGFVRLFERGMPAYEYARDGHGSRIYEEDKMVVAVESPVRFMDRVRGELRYAERTDESNILTQTFALLEIAKKGKPEEDTNAKVKTPGVLPKMQRYEYRPIARAKLETLETVLNVRDAMRAVFDHVAVSLLPRELKKHDREFLVWIHERGGEARSHEIAGWISKTGNPGGGQDPASTYVRKFCDKQGKAGTRTPWRVRPEALAMIGLTPRSSIAASMKGNP